MTNPPPDPDLATPYRPPLDPDLATPRRPPLDPDLAAIMTEVVEPAGHRASRFGHREHVHLAFIAARRGDAAGLLRDWITQIAASHGAPDRYHETITTAWAQIVAHHVRAGPRSRTSTRSPAASRRCSTSPCSPGTTLRSRCHPRPPARTGSPPTWLQSPRPDPDRPIHRSSRNTDRRIAAC